MSPISIIKFVEPWLRRVLDQWFCWHYSQAKPPKALYYMDRHGNATNHEIKLKPQIANWDRVKGIPRETIMKALVDMRAKKPDLSALN